MNEPITHDMQELVAAEQASIPPSAQELANDIRKHLAEQNGSLSHFSTMISYLQSYVETYRKNIERQSAAEKCDLPPQEKTLELRGIKTRQDLLHGMWKDELQRLEKLLKKAGIEHAGAKALIIVNAFRESAGAPQFPPASVQGIQSLLS